MASSYFFYAWGETFILAVLLISSYIDYIISLRLEKGENNKKILLGIAIGLNVLSLVYFKYANFFIGQSIDLLQFFGLKLGQWKEIALPIGISFFTFQKISYLVDVYRGTTEPAKRLHHYLLYVSFFPQLIAGPIVRYKDIYLQIIDRHSSFSDIGIGFNRFALGLSKKVLIANPMAQIADSILSHPIDTLPGAYLWLAILAYSLQIYFDFSGYSDMAIGIARMFGFRILENFNRPYIAKSITEFWRRWHISLSNWMRDYLYIPLGGNRINPTKTYFNLWIVFLLSGFWHGASWNFILWGAFHGTLITFEKWKKNTSTLTLPSWSQQAVTFLFVLIGWIIFRLETIPEVGTFIIGMVTPNGFFSDGFMPLFEIISPRSRFTLLIAAIIAFTPIIRSKGSILKLPLVLQTTAAWVLFALSVVSLASDSYNPFIYFRF
ncbi:hypothetical protein MLD52_02855 [Puniceicoccaceae bacterium K14]|nr:hypothetical protein [Puniceicoccaceae bacterium K14]